MTTRTPHRRPGAIHASFLAACSIGGIRVALAPETGVGEAEFKAAAGNMRTIAESAQRTQADATRRLQEFDARLSNVEQKSTRGGGGGGPIGDAFGGDDRSLGDQVANSDALREFKAAGMRGTSRIEVKTTITSAAGSTGGAHGGLIAPDRAAGVEMLPRRAMTIRSLCRQSRTESNTVLMMRQTLRTNAAAPAPEASKKAESAYAWEEVSVPVRTIAHWVPVTRQVVDDAASLRGIVNGELRFGLQDTEETQLLLGNGAGENLAGIMPQAQAFAAPFEVSLLTPFDRLLQALAQASVGLYKPSAIVLNTADAFKLHSIKDTAGRYIGGGPYEALSKLLWSVPWVDTNIMPPNQFLLGDFANAAEIYDRMDAEVLISDSHEDYFARNLYAIRAEQRLAVLVRAPRAFVRGTLTDA